jgi:hypothetical protein
MKTRDELATAALELANDAPAANTNAERAAYNQRLQDHLTELVNLDGSTDGIAAHCERFELSYLPNRSHSQFTKDVALDCRVYSKRYGVTLGDAVAEWEGEDDRGGFGLTVEQAAHVCACLVDDGFDLAAIEEKNP